MNVQLVEASLEQKPVLHRLMQLYLHDTSEFTGDDVNQEGLFTYRYFDEYWAEPDRVPFLVYCDAALAGFVLVNTYTVALAPGAGRSIAEFFIMRKYRRRGVGQAGRFPLPLTGSRGYGRSANTSITWPVSSSGGRLSRSIPVAFFRK